MAVETGVQYYGSLAAANTPLDLRTTGIMKIAKLAPFLRFLDFVKKGPKPKAEKVEYAADDYLTHTVTTSGATADTTTGTVTVTSGDETKVVAGDKLQNPLTREMMLVTSTVAGTINVTRSIGDASGNIANAQVLYILSNTAAEGSDPPTAKHQPASWTYNYLEHVKKPIDITGRMQRLGTREYEGKDALYNNEKMKRFQEMLRELELTFFLGQLATSGSTSTRRTYMQGLEEFIRDADSRTYNVNGSALTWAIIEALADQAFNDTDVDELWGFASPRYMSQFGQLLYAKWTPDEVKSRKLGATVMKVETSHGVINLIREHYFRNDLAAYMFLVDKTCIEKVETIPLHCKDDVQAEKSDVRQGYWEWEGTILVRHPTRLTLAYGLTA
ncbi:MAG: DUF5309 family protein [Patescibacteria group bacterium]